MSKYNAGKANILSRRHTLLGVVCIMLRVLILAIYMQHVTRVLKVTMLGSKGFYLWPTSCVCQVSPLETCW